MRDDAETSTSRIAGRRAAPLLLVALLVFGMTGLSGGCSKSPPTRPNILLITLDTTRADACSLYGSSEPTTPFLDAMAIDALVFDAAIAPGTWTLPVHASLWTGVYPSVHGAVSSRSEDGEFGRPLPANRVTITEVFQRHGYQTAGFVGGPFLTRGYGFQRGFDHYDDRLDDYGIGAGELNRRCKAWLESERDPSRPLFLVLNYYDPHRPYDPSADLEYPFGDPSACREAQPVNFDPITSGDLSDPVAVECARLQYSREIYATDSALRDLLEHLRIRGELRRSLVAVVGDHGEAFGEDETWGHGNPGVLNQRWVPLVLAQSDGTRKGRITAPTSIVRLSRTLLEAAGIEPPGHWLGPSLLSHETPATPPVTERFSPNKTFTTLSYRDFACMIIEGTAGTETKAYLRTTDEGIEVRIPRGEQEVYASEIDRARRDWQTVRRTLPRPPMPGVPSPSLHLSVEPQLRNLGYVK